MKKLLAMAICMLIICASDKVLAHELLWYDKDCNFNKFAKIVLYPLSNAWEDPDDYQLGKEGTRNFRLNSYFDDKLTKKLKKVNFIRIANEIQEKDAILTNDFGALLGPFDSEKARADAVEEATMADMYIVPQFRENSVHEDISPRCEWDVELKSWIMETDGPDGDKIYNEVTETVHHVIPETKIYLHIMQAEFTGYNNKAEMIMTSLQQDRSYGVDETSQFKRLVDDFQKAFSDARKETNSTKGLVRISFTPVEIQGEYSDDFFFTNAMNNAVQTSAMKKIKKARVSTNPDSLLVNYYIRSTVTHCDLVPVWHDPWYSVSTNSRLISEEKWKDKDEKEHTKRVTQYWQTISDHYAYWSFYWSVASNFWLVDPKNNVIISKSYADSDDKPMDAYRHASDDFCKQINSYLKEQEKNKK